MTDLVPSIAVFAIALVVCFAGWSLQSRRHRQGRDYVTRRSWMRWMPPAALATLVLISAAIWITGQPNQPERSGALTMVNEKVDADDAENPPSSEASRQQDQALLNLANQLVLLEQTQVEDRQRLSRFESLTNDLRADLHFAQGQVSNMRQRLIDATTELEESRSARRVEAATAADTNQELREQVESFRELSGKLRSEVAEARRIAVQCREQLASQQVENRLDADAPPYVAKAGTPRQDENYARIVSSPTLTVRDSSEWRDSSGWRPVGERAVSRPQLSYSNGVARTYAPITSIPFHESPISLYPTAIPAALPTYRSWP